MQCGGITAAARRGSGRFARAGLLLMCGSATAWGAGPGQAGPKETELPQVSSTMEFDGGAVPYRYQMFLSPATTADGNSATRLRTLLDLTGALTSLGEALQQQLPDRRCAGYKPDNWVVKLRELSAEPDRDWLLLGLVAEVQLWACVDLKFLGEGKTELGRSYVSIELPMALRAHSEQVRLESDRPRINVDGDLGRAARLYFAARGEDLSQVLADRVAEVDASELKFDLPALLVANGARIDSARFVSVGGMPHAEIDIVASTGFATWLDMLRRLWGRAP